MKIVEDCSCCGKTEYCRDCHASHDICILQQNRIPRSAVAPRNLCVRGRWHCINANRSVPQTSNAPRSAHLSRQRRLSPCRCWWQKLWNRKAYATPSYSQGDIIDICRAVPGGLHSSPALEWKQNRQSRGQFMLGNGSSERQRQGYARLSKGREKSSGQNDRAGRDPVKGGIHSQTIISIKT